MSEHWILTFCPILLLMALEFKCVLVRMRQASQQCKLFQNPSRHVKAITFDRIVVEVDNQTCLLEQRFDSLTRFLIRMHSVSIVLISAYIFSTVYCSAVDSIEVICKQQTSLNVQHPHGKIFIFEKSFFRFLTQTLGKSIKII